VDISQNVMGLPQVLGRKKSTIMALLLAGIGILVVVVSLTSPSADSVDFFI